MKKSTKSKNAVQPEIHRPRREDSDSPVVTLLLDESERLSSLGNQWLKTAIPNPFSAEQCFRQGWAYATAAVWLRGRTVKQFTTVHAPESLKSLLDAAAEVDKSCGGLGAGYKADDVLCENLARMHEALRNLVSPC